MGKNHFKIATVTFAIVSAVLIFHSTPSYSWSWGTKTKKEEPKKTKSESQSSAEQKSTGLENTKTNLEAIAQQLLKEPIPGKAVENVHIRPLAKTQKVYVPHHVVPKPFTPVKASESKEGKDKTVTTVTGSTQAQVDPDSE